jgi:hypothetical protein
MKAQLTKLIDVKSIITIGLAATIIYLVVSGRPVDEKVFLLFTNIATMTFTYFFTKNLNKPTDTTEK